MKLAAVCRSCIAAFKITLSKYIIKATWDEDTPPTPNYQFHDYFTWEGVNIWCPLSKFQNLCSHWFQNADLYW